MNFIAPFLPPPSNALAVFLDRDGTLIYDPGYLGNPDEVMLLAGVGESLSYLCNILGFKLVVISNQSGVARGLITVEQVNLVNNRINELLEPFSAKIDAFYFCPFHPDFSPVDSAACRKPAPQMVFRAAEDFSLSLAHSYFIGDSQDDILCAKNAGVKSILVRTGNGSNHFSVLQKENNLPNFVINVFSEACDIIRKDLSGVDSSS